MRIREAGVKAMLAMTKPSDAACCVFARSVLAMAYGEDVVGLAPYARWCIILDDPKVPGVGPWSPVEAAGIVGIAEATFIPPTGTPLPRPGSWHLVQGWQGTPLKSSGHTFLWWAVNGNRHSYGEKLDSAEAKFRPPPGPELHGFQKWDDIVDRYKGGLAVAVLRPSRTEL